MPFCNQNGIMVPRSEMGNSDVFIPFELQKCPNFAKKLEMESWDRELSKNGLGMCIQPLDRFLCSKMYHPSGLKKCKKLHFWPKIAKLLKIMKIHRTLEQSYRNVQNGFGKLMGHTFRKKIKNKMFLNFYAFLRPKRYDSIFSTQTWHTFDADRFGRKKA